MPTWADPLITTVTDKCRMCYACVRECPAKAIQVQDGQAKVIQPRCIGCGNCYRMCPMDVFTWDDLRNMPEVTYAGDCWFEGTCMMECPKRAIEISLPLSSW